MSKYSRRGVFKTTAAIAAATALPKWFVEETLDAAEVKAPTSANDKPNIALVGCGGRGRGDIKDASKFGNVVALCDVDEKHAEHASADYPGSKAYKDFRKVMERDDIHIIVTATPDHWHTLVNLAALRAGKDVYSEKPLTLTINEGKYLVDTVKKTNRVLQVGSQQRSDAKFRLACELVRNGRIGKLQEVQVVLPAGHREGPFPVEPVPAELDWDFWQGQAPTNPYCRQRTHTTFRFWYDYSGGTVTDWGAHHNDIARWAIGEDGPTSVEGKPLADIIPGGYTAFSQYHIEYTWAKTPSTTASPSKARTAGSSSRAASSKPASPRSSPSRSPPAPSACTPATTTWPISSTASAPAKTPPPPPKSGTGLLAFATSGSSPCGLAGS
jgi:hypothetical protein